MVYKLKLFELLASPNFLYRWVCTLRLVNLEILEFYRPRQSKIFLLEMLLTFSFALVSFNEVV